MKKILLLCLGVFGILAAAPAGKVPLASQDLGAQHVGGLFSPQLLENILHYQSWGELFVYLQVHWFKLLFGSVGIGMIVVFFLHYLIIGAKEFSHEGRKFYIFSLFMRVVHWIAALGFVLIIPTGFMMIFGKYLGGGELVLTARHIHSIGTVLFAVTVIPIFLAWFIPMLPTFDDIKWMMIAGGYLSKKKRELPAGKFNAGQKIWFWLVTVGGFVMIITGAMMYFQDFNLPVLKSMGLNLDQIDMLRLSAIIHNFVGMAIVAMFITHLYLSLFGIKGSLESMIDGHKSEDELKHLHSSYYRKLMKKEKAQAEAQKTK